MVFIKVLIIVNISTTYIWFHQPKMSIIPACSRWTICAENVMSEATGLPYLQGPSRQAERDVRPSGANPGESGMLKRQAFLICKGPPGREKGCAKERSDCVNPAISFPSIKRGHFMDDASTKRIVEAQSRHSEPFGCSSRSLLWGACLRICKLRCLRSVKILASLNVVRSCNYSSKNVEHQNW